MGETFPDASTSAKPPEDRLDSWKEIAAYLDRDVTTVQRWEKREGMPVHRHQHDRIGSVYAFRAELDEWVRSRNLQVSAAENENQAVATDGKESPNPSVPQNSANRWKLIFAVAAVVAVLVVSAALWLRKTEYFWRNPIAAARFQTVTDFDGIEEAATI